MLKDWMLKIWPHGTFAAGGAKVPTQEKKNVEDLTEAAIQKCFLKWVFFKAIRILKTACVYIHFKKKLQVKSLQLSQK